MRPGVEVGWLVDPQLWGQGYGSDALDALVSSRELLNILADNPARADARVKVQQFPAQPPGYGNRRMCV